MRADPPLLGVISRLAAQKGIDLVVEVAAELVATSDAQLVVLGSGEPQLEGALETRRIVAAGTHIPFRAADAPSNRNASLRQSPSPRQSAVELSRGRSQR